MKKKIIVILFILICSVSFVKDSEAALPTFDAVNAVLSEVRNALMQSQFAQDIALSLQRLEQLRATYQELLRFHSGLDEFFEVLVGDGAREFIRLGRARIRDAFIDFGWVTPRLEFLAGTSEPQDIRNVLEEITGEIPDAQFRPYILFEEMQVVEGFQLAQEIREAGDETRAAAQALESQAKTASPKGAARLAVEGQAQMIHLSQQNQEALAKLIELSSVQVEQVSRDEKRWERERLRYMDEMKSGTETLWEAR